MNVPGNGNVHKPGDVNPQQLTDHQTRVIAPQSASQSSNNSSSSLPSLGSPSRFNQVAVNSAFFLTALPTDVLFHTAGFLHAMDLVLLGRTCKSLYRISGDIQRSVPGEHWGGGFNRRIAEQRQLTQKMFSWLQERSEQQCTQTMPPVAPPGPVTLENSSVVVPTASSIGSRFRHVSIALNRSPLVLEIGESLVNAEGWHHLELVVSDIRPLPRFLQQLASIQIANRTASSASSAQPDRQLSIRFTSTGFDYETGAAVDALSALLAPACGVRIASLHFPKEGLEFVPVIEGSPHIEQFSASFDWNAAPMLDALRNSSPALRSLSLHFSQVDDDQPYFGSFFDDPLAWQLDRLSIHASRMAASGIPLDFIGSCKIQDLRLHGVEFDSDSNQKGTFGAAVAANTIIETLELKYCRFPGSSFDRLLSSLQLSTALKCLMLHHNIQLDGPSSSTQVVDAIKMLKSLVEVHFDKGFYSMNARKISALQVARPDLRIFVDKALISLGAGLDGDERASGCQSDSDESTDGSYYESADSDHSMDDGENDSSGEDQSQDDFMADIDRVIKRAKIAEKQ